MDRESTARRPVDRDAEGDPGFYGPDSVTRRVHGHPSAALGGLRALMLQALHPLAMAGVAQHSQYRTDPWGRFGRTAEYVRTMTYGSTAQAEAAAARVRAVHRRVSGVEPESGTPYRADDPALLLWVHCAEVDSFLTAYRRCGGRLSLAQADAYVSEQVRSAALVGVDPRRCPASVDALRGYFRAVRPALHATAEARAALRFLLLPPMPPEAGPEARPIWTALSSTAFGLLPAWARARYGPGGLLLANPGTGLAATFGGRLLCLAAPRFPARVRTPASPTRETAAVCAAGR